MASETIMIVDDVLQMRVLLRAMLQSWGYKTIEASTAEEMMQFLAEDMKVDLVLLDLELGAIDGFQALRVLKPMIAENKLKVCAVSGRRDRDDVVNVLAAGAADYVVKPVDPLTFRKKIEALFGREHVDSLFSIPVELKGFVNLGVIELPIQIVEISEAGLTMVVAFDVPDTLVDMHIRIPDLEPSPQAKTILAVKIAKKSTDAKTGQTALKVSYLGLPESGATQIRKYIVSQSQKQTKA